MKEISVWVQRISAWNTRWSWVAHAPTVLALRPENIQQRVDFFSKNGLDVKRHVNTLPKVLYFSVGRCFVSPFSFASHKHNCCVVLKRHICVAKSRGSRRLGVFDREVVSCIMLSIWHSYERFGQNFKCGSGRNNRCCALGCPYPCPRAQCQHAVVLRCIAGRLTHTQAP